jgi:PAS domain S-box-containing protein
MDPKEPRQRPSILVVDDDPRILAVLTDLLERADFEVLTASSAAETKRLLRERQPSVALIDILMPVMSGLELCRQLKSDPRTSEMRIVLLSAMSDTRDVLAGIEAGAADYIKKPFDRDEVVFRVRAHVNLVESLRTQRRAQERLSLISRASTDAIILLDEQKKIFHWNEAAEAMFGYQAGEMVGKDLKVLIASREFHQLGHAAYHEVLFPEGDSQDKRVLELMAVKKCGDFFYMEMTLTTAQLDGGQWALCVIRDVTEQRFSLQQLRSLATAIEQSVESVLITDPNGCIRYCNPAFERSSGYTQQEVLGQNPRVLGAREVSREFYRNLWTTIKSGKVWSGHFKNKRKDGSLYEEEATISPIYERPGQITGYVAVKRDVTERMRLEKERLSIERKLRVSENRFRTILESIPVGIAIVGMDRRIRWANRAALEMVQARNLQDIIGRSCNASLCEFQDGHCPFFDGTEAVSSAETQVHRADGTVLPVLKTAHSVEFGEELVRLETFVDLRERKQLEAELSHVRRLEAVGQLAAGIAHEINTPIQYVGDSTQFLQESFEDISRLIPRYRESVGQPGGGEGDASLADEIRALERAIDLEWLMAEIPGSFARCMDGIGRVTKIVGAMKEFAHPDTGHQAPADLNRALINTITISRNEHKYVADVVTEFADIPEVLCRISELNQAFLNIIVNAAHAIAEVVGNSGQKGRITVATSLHGDQVHVSISDTGCGIPAAIRERIFDPFFTTKAVGKGTGQGLSIARSIVVDKHGGSLAVESTPGGGTTFVIKLPVDGRQSAAASGE